MPRELRVLVVDDHPVNRLLLAQVLKTLGCNVAEAADGDAALDRAREDDFDLICLDRHMPGLSGDEVAERLPADQLVMAWSTDLADLPRRFDGVLAKPLSIASVQAALERASRARPSTWSTPHSEALVAA